MQDVFLLLPREQVPEPAIASVRIGKSSRNSAEASTLKLTLEDMWQVVK